ncbi:glycerophosphodiester phosphodiesterase [Liquorilactobacillus capillatus]|uniref:Glycerophosphoryl diester phosphodiesterase family protein n=1 Tax=Liquorilactobacillus capillatus DSM 19910 TaxID=1423731 RepID=A0A0R1M166_9LACO|nr:glycerophosphodiester phosphodiesterase [Liquorilactobacillus capillatus]KRL01741.1 glycerophosphoryl diester phosphodiesterase family protein [Liquorilactobacillus capillatus DSM 19910]
MNLLGKDSGSKRKYLVNIVLANMLILFIVIPALVVCGNWLLDAGKAGSMMARFSSLTLAGGLIFLVLLMYAAYFEYIFLLLCSYSYMSDKGFSTYSMLQHSLGEAAAVFSKKIFFFLFYFLLILPFSGTGYTSELLAKIKIPIFILDYIFKERVIFVSVLALLYLFLLYLGLRFAMVLPFMILKQMTLRAAVLKSLTITKKYFGKLFLAFLGLVLGALFFNLVSYLLLLGIQQLWELFIGTAALYSATALATIAWLIRLITAAVVVVGSLQIVLFFLFKEEGLKKGTLKLPSSEKHHPVLELGLLVGCLFILLFIRVRDNYSLMRQPVHNVPIVVAHRGVDGDNALQNSLSALKKTHQSAQPYYTEMDIQETKDHQFVVCHDSNLKKLTGKNLIVQKLTLAQAIRLTAREGRHAERLVSFNKYLSTAHRIGQRLIVEIKVSKYDSKNMRTLFIRKYAQTLLKHKDVVHSLDYKTVAVLKKKQPQLKVGYILPFNALGVPKTAADFYSVEYSTLNDDFISEVQREHKKVYTWTVNRSPSMYGDLSMNIDGIITDNGSKLNKIIGNYYSENTYTYKMLALMLNSYR